ncbi:MAG: Cof-type HAD-IIB family hydrolase [Bacillota bacterium]
MCYRLLAIDLDDTLLDNKCCVSPRTKEAIKKALDKGLYVTLATGRMYRSALPYALELGMDVPLITYQGALVKTSVTKEILYHRPVPLELAKEVIREGEKRGFPSNIYLDDRLYVDRMTPEAEGYLKLAKVPAKEVGDLSSFLTEEPTKVLLMGEESKLNELWPQMAQKFGKQLYITKSKPNFLEFTHPDATKGQGLVAVSRFLGVKKEEIMVFGDSYNDLELFKYAGFSVAMGNAREEVKKQADYITQNNDDDGVAEAIEKLVLNDSGCGR